MRKLIVSTFTTLDGVVEDPGGFSAYEHSGWANAYFDDESADIAMRTLQRADLFLCGRVTYEAFSAFWPAADGPYADRLNAMPKYVASTTLHEPLNWNAKLIGSDVATSVERLKQLAGGDIVMYGSAELMSTLMEQDLIDEYRIWVHPIVLGSGKRLFEHTHQVQSLHLDATTHLGNGIVVLTYRPAPK